MTEGGRSSPVQSRPQGRGERPGARGTARRLVPHPLAQLAWDVRATLTWVHVAVPAALALVLWGILGRPVYFRSAGEALAALELLLPVLAGFFIGDAVTREWTEGTAEWRVAQPGGPVRLLLLRTVTALLMWAITATTCLLLVQVFYLRPAGELLGWGEAMVLLGPPALFFTGIGGAGALLGRSSLAGFLAAAGYWALDLTSRGAFTGPFHVLYRTGPLEHLSYEANRWWLLAGGSFLLLVGGAIFAKAERWLR